MDTKPKPTRVKGKVLGELTVSLADYGITDWQYPISPLRTAGSGFGRRSSPTQKGKIIFHNGQDIGCRRGERIYAAGDGVVQTSLYSTSAGNFIVIGHTDHKGMEVETRYLHLSRRLVKRDTTVRAGEVVGYCGNTGQSTSPHLHFEVKIDGQTINPFRPRTFTEKDGFSDVDTDSTEDLAVSVL